MRNYVRTLWGPTFNGDLVEGLTLSFSAVLAWRVVCGKTNTKTKARAKKLGWGVCRVLETHRQLDHGEKE